MNFILPFSIIGASASVLLGFLFAFKGKGKLISNFFLGILFLLLSVRLGKLFAQEYAPVPILNIYFNLMQAAFLAIGPVVWLYIRTYLSPKINKTYELTHFIPSFILLIGAFYLRQIGGEFIWKFVYWSIQIHPLLYAFWSVRFLFKSSRSKVLTVNQKVWLYGLLAVVCFIVAMNILYFTIQFPFYLVTALLLIITLYLICFLAFNNKIDVLIGKNDQKYKNFNLQTDKINQLYKKINKVLIDENLYLNEKLKISDIAEKTDIPVHIISRVINESSQKTFPQYVNHLRIERAKRKLIEEANKKIIAIAFESGFRSLSAFNRVFKKIAGSSPSEFRKKNTLKKIADL